MPHDSTEIGLPDVAAFLFRQSKFIAICFALGLAVSIGYFYSLPTKYKAVLEIPRIATGPEAAPNYWLDENSSFRLWVRLDRETIEINSVSASRETARQSIENIREKIDRYAQEEGGTFGTPAPLQVTKIEPWNHLLFGGASGLLLAFSALAFKYAWKKVRSGAYGE